MCGSKVARGVFLSGNLVIKSGKLCFLWAIRLLKGRIYRVQIKCLWLYSSVHLHNVTSYELCESSLFEVYVAVCLWSSVYSV